MPLRQNKRRACFSSFGLLMIPQTFHGCLVSCALESESPVFWRGLAASQCCTPCGSCSFFIQHTQEPALWARLPGLDSSGGVEMVFKSLWNYYPAAEMRGRLSILNFISDLPAHWQHTGHGHLLKFLPEKSISTGDTLQPFHYLKMALFFQ